MASIVKVQRPLYTNDSSNHWLIYDEYKKRYSMLPEAEISYKSKTMMGTDYKAFFLGYWNKKDQSWTITKRVADNKGF